MPLKIIEPRWNAEQGAGTTFQRKEGQALVDWRVVIRLRGLGLTGGFPKPYSQYARGDAWNGSATTPHYFMRPRNDRVHQRDRVHGFQRSAAEGVLDER
jgi:hypothetical protein